MSPKRIAIISVVLVFLSVLAYAQPDLDPADVERATREVDRPMPERFQAGTRALPEQIPEVKKDKKEEAGESELFVKKIELVGCESLDPEEFRETLARYENRRVTLEELKVLARQIERDYLRKGVIAACFIPVQEIKEGVTTLQVVEAKVGDLEIQEHKYFNKERIAYYWQLEPDEVLYYDKISRSLQLMNKNPDREVRATLHAGKRPQTTDVLLKVNTHFPFHLTSTFDREGTISTGQLRPGLGFRHNNFLGFDDSLLGGYTFGKNFTGKYLYHRVPITNFGTYLLYGHSYSKSFPKKEYTFWQIGSRAKNTSVSLHQDIFSKNEYVGEVYLTLDAKDKTTKMLTGTTNKDRLRILRLGNNLVQKGFGYTNYISPELSQGLNLFGARRRNALSSRGSENTFTKFNLEVQHKRALPLKLQANLKFDSQICSSKLPPQEEYYLGGINSVRGYPSGDYLADNALQTNLELLIPGFFIPDKVRTPYAYRPLKDDTTAILFFDYGYGRRKGASGREKETRNLKSVGAGIRVRFLDQALVRLEWGFPFGDDTITEDGHSDFHFSVDLQEKIPEEIERISIVKREENIKVFAWHLLDEELNRPGSTLREKLYALHYDAAQKAYEEGRLVDAKEHYAQIVNIGQALYKQAEDYVRSCTQQEDELRENQELAIKYFKEEKFDKAKGIWNKIIKEAKVNPFSLEY